MAKDTDLSTDRARRLSRSRPASTSSPLSVMQRFAHEVDRMFDAFGLGRGFLAPPRMTERETWVPDIDIVQRDDQLTVRADLPGLRKEDVSVELAERVLTIEGERTHDAEEERDGVYRRQRSSGTFYRAISLPEGVITEQAKATFSNGVLEVTMPALPAAEGRRLEIAEQPRT
jgi:HSP20 family protein